MRIILLGASGQLGLDFQDECKLHPELELIAFERNRLDVSDSNEVEKTISNLKPNYVVNCAAFTHVDGAEDDQQQAMLVNAEAVAKLGAATKANDCQLIHISTDYVFNGSKNTPYSEEDVCDPIGYYGYTKRRGEELLMELQVPGAIIRTSWLYSSRGKNFLKTMMHYGSQRNELTVVFDQVGTPTYAAHLAQAIIKMIQQDYRSTNTEIFHFGNEGVCSWYDFAVEIMDQASIHCKVKPIESKDFPTKTKRPPYSVLNKAKIKSRFRIEITHWKKALEECLQKMD